ncbi:MAG: hypothetical protein AAFQ27_02600 [Pseudomonadota bacterium]
MSSNAATLFPKTTALLGVGVLLAVASPLAAQDDGSITSSDDDAAASEESAPAPPRPFDGLNLSVTVPKNESDALLEQDCEEEADAAKITNEIVVCRQLGEASDGSWNREDFERRYAQRTQGEQPVDVAGGGIFRGPATVGGLCVIPPCPAEAAIMIDVEALPQAPEGSDADRIARGLPPLGREAELSPEEIAERRRALGLDAPPIPEAAQE